MDKAERDRIARKMLDSLREGEITGPDDLEDAFFTFLDSGTDRDDMLQWMIAYLGYGMEYLQLTGGTVGMPKPVHQWLGRCPVCGDCHTDLSEVARMNR
jgi:hypothetical protein